jgi:hypothetical protein
MDKNSNYKVLYFFENLEKNIRMKEKGMTPDKLRKAYSEEAARMDARVDATLQGKKFDESETPPEELVGIDKKIIQAILERQLKDIVRD